MNTDAPHQAALVVRIAAPGDAVRPEALRALSDGLALLLDAADWTTRPVLPAPDAPAESIAWPLALDTTDRRRTWRELCQGIALARLVSALQPDWVLTVQDETALWSHSADAPHPLVLRAGSATRPRHGGPPSPAADQDRALHAVLWQALGAELAARWAVRPPPPEPESPSGSAPPASARPSPAAAGPASAARAPSRGFDAALLGARVVQSPTGAALELHLDLVNQTDEVLQDVAVMVVLRGAGDAPLGAAELDLPALAPRERSNTRRTEPLVHDPADLFAVEVQVHATALARVHGESPVGEGPP